MTGDFPVMQIPFFLVLFKKNQIYITIGITEKSIVSIDSI